jgi:AcrR family transcriptional regulator
MTRITKPIEERRQEIIDTAKELFIEKGFDKTQVADITAKLNVATGTVYHYFKSKTEILYPVIDELAEKKKQKKQYEINNSVGSAIDDLKQMFTAYDREPEIQSVKSSFINDPALVQYYLTKLSCVSIPFLTSLIVKGKEDGSWNCDYPDETAVFILQGLMGVMSREHTFKDSESENNKRLEAYMNIVFRVLSVNNKFSGINK